MVNFTQLKEAESPSPERAVAANPSFAQEEPKQFLSLKENLSPKAMKAGLSRQGKLFLEKNPQIDKPGNEDLLKHFTEIDTIIYKLDSLNLEASDSKLLKVIDKIVGTDESFGPVNASNPEKRNTPEPETRKTSLPGPGGRS